MLETAATTGALVSSILPFALVLVLMYFMIIRPQKKKDKKMEEMRSSIEIGDTVTTIGGIVGLVVAIKEDTIVLETGTDRSKIRFKRWAISEVNKLAD
ncbi:MAG: preprotein translocase subunit YajC [Oscillospiraceae bacterium]|nr:preprotein translocase subunit YajC [Oscillospiraceae bacterium]